MLKPCIFLDRDGVINKDRVDYVYRVEDFFIHDGVIDALKLLKAHGYILIVITNQSGIAKGIYQESDVMNCYNYLQEQCGGIIDDIYYSKHHPNFTSASLMQKPDSLMLEKAMAKHGIDPNQSWMIGDAERDIKAGKKAGVKTIHIHNGKEDTQLADYQFENLLEAAQFVLDAR